MRRDWSTAREFGRFLQKLHLLQPAEPADLSNDDIIPFLNVNTVVTDAQPKKINLTTLKSFVGFGAVGNNTEIQFNDNGSLGASSSLTWDDTAKKLDVDGNVVITGDLTVEGASTILETETVKVEDKNIELGVVASPTDVTADGGGITLKGTTDKTINWIDATDAWTSSERFSVPLGTDNAPSLTFTGDPDTGIYSPGADQVAISTNGTGRLFVDASGNVGVGATPSNTFDVTATTNPIASIRTTTAATSVSTLKLEGYRISADAGRLGEISIINTRDGDEQASIEITADGDTEGKFTFKSSTNSLCEFGNSFTRFFSSNTERARIDSSGRLLVGTSSSTVAFRGIFQGNSAGTNPGAICIAFDSSTPADGDILGALDFSDSSHARAARIECERDGGTWTSGVSQPSRLVFSTTADGASSPTQRMKLDNRGQLSLQSTTSTFDVATTQAAGTIYSTIISRHSATNGSPGSGTLSFRVYSNGDVQNTNNSYGAISDIKLKENIVDASSQWDDIKALRPVKYNFKPETGQQTHTQIGLIAQEVEQVSPGLVSESPDRDEDGNDLGTVTKSVNYSVLYMKAVKALQEAMERIETLEAEVAALKAS